MAAVTRRSVVLLTAAALTFAGCGTNPERESSPPLTVRPSDLVAVEGPTPAGRFYVKAGADSLASDLYEVTLPSTFRRLTTDARVTTVGGCSSQIVVAAAQKEFGYLDTVQELRDRTLATIDRLGPVHASGPDLTADCRLLFYETKGSEPNTTGEIKRFDPRTGATTIVTSGRTVKGANWGPDGQVLVLRREPSGPKLDIIEANGTKREIDPEVPDVGNTPWGKSGWIAMAVFTADGQPPTATRFLNPTSGQRSTLDGWLPLAWSPTGDDLLVRDAAKGTTLAVVSTSDLTKTRNVGVSNAGIVWDAVWLPSG